MSQETLVIDATVSLQGNGDRNSILRCRVPTTALNALGAEDGDALRFQIKGGQLVGFGVVDGGGKSKPTPQPKIATAQSIAPALAPPIVAKAGAKKKGSKKGQKKAAKSNGGTNGLANMFKTPAAQPDDDLNDGGIVPVTAQPVPIRGGVMPIARSTASKSAKSGGLAGPIFPVK